MFGLNPAALYIIAGLLFTNLFTFTAWRLANADAERKSTQATECAALFKNYRERVKTLGKQQEKKVAEVIAASNLAVEETRKSYETSLARLRADYQRLRNQYAQRGASTSPVPAPDISAHGIDAATQDAVSDPVRLAAECAETTLNMIWLQEHERQQSNIKEK